MKQVRVGSRGSRLALAQTGIAIAALKKERIDADFKVVTISTRGDVDKRPLFTMDEKGIFEKEVNEAVRAGDVDFAVHSLKDVPSDLSDELLVASIPKRARPNDVLIADDGRKLKELAPGSTIGTSSLRRAVQIMKIRSDLNVRPIRGNVETRVKKVIGGEYAAIVLAEAGLCRIGMQDVIVERFRITDFVPAPGQGAIAIVCRKENKKLAEMLARIQDPKSRAEVLAERELVARLEGGCRFPIGAVAIAKGASLTLHASVFSADGTRQLKMVKVGKTREPEKLGNKVADTMIKQGALEMAEGWRTAVQEWNSRL